MPYISDQDKEYVKHHGPDTGGHLNFLLTNVCLFYLAKKGLSYKTINDILGALEGAKLEFYRRIAVPYEEEKIKDNGDIYPDTSKVAVPSSTILTP